MTPDPFDLERFTEAQAPIIGAAMAELAAGRKRSHWMWYVFPQIAGLGASAMSQRYAISSLEEARAYLDDPVLGSRLRQCTALVNGIQGRTVHDIFGSPDDMKFRSSMTLFAAASEGDDLFRAALTKFFAGGPDPATLQLIAQARR